MKKQRVVVGMSGGVDSSLTAALLIEQGYEVEGVTLQLEDGDYHEKSCCNAEAVEEALEVATELGIKIHVKDYREEFRKAVINLFVADYINGRTPNPCINCNKKIKFAKLFEVADEIGADYIATGHYARVIYEDGRYKIKKAIDINKDQSYVLYNLTAEMLSRIIFPLGGYSKEEVRRMAREKKLLVADKPDSQEICFVPNNDYKTFLKEFAPNAKALQIGEIVDDEERVLGNHHGVANYTIGQRKGLGIANEYPLYVIRLDVKNNKVIVGKNEELFTDKLIADNVNWIYEPKLPMKLQAKIRYGNKVTDCEVSEVEDKIKVKFYNKVRAITPGQSVVFYDEDELIGGGQIV